jgi:hypothetical protein
MFRLIAALLMFFEGQNSLKLSCQHEVKRYDLPNNVTNNDSHLRIPVNLSDKVEKAGVEVKTSHSQTIVEKKCVSLHALLSSGNLVQRTLQPVVFTGYTHFKEIQCWGGAPRHLTTEVGPIQMNEVSPYPLNKL